MNFILISQHLHFQFGSFRFVLSLNWVVPLDHLTLRLLQIQRLNIVLPIFNQFLLVFINEELRLITTRLYQSFFLSTLVRAFLDCWTRVVVHMLSIYKCLSLLSLLIFTLHKLLISLKSLVKKIIIKFFRRYSRLWDVYILN